MSKVPQPQPKTRGVKRPEFAQGIGWYGRRRYQGKKRTPVAERPLPSWPPAQDPWAHAPIVPDSVVVVNR